MFTRSTGLKYDGNATVDISAVQELKAFIASLIKVIQDVKDIGEDATILQQQLAIAAKKLMELVSDHQCLMICAWWHEQNNGDRN